MHRVVGCPMSVMSRTTTPGTPRSETSASCSPAAGGAVQCALAGGAPALAGLGVGKAAGDPPPAPGDDPAEDDADGEWRLTAVLPPQAVRAATAARATTLSAVRGLMR